MQLYTLHNILFSERLKPSSQDIGEFESEATWTQPTIHIRLWRLKTDSETSTTCSLVAGKDTNGRHSSCKTLWT